MNKVVVITSRTNKKELNKNLKTYKKIILIFLLSMFSFLLGTQFHKYSTSYDNSGLSYKVVKQAHIPKEHQKTKPNKNENIAESNLMRKTTDRIKVLLLSYSRSGSSLLGEMLSAHPSTSYYFEPLWQHNLNCEQQMNSTMVAGEMENIVGGLLDCYWPQVKQLKKFSFRKNSQGCNKTTISVVKTIRLHMNGVMPWIMKNPMMKVVHLIRDPRAQTKSRLRKKNSFRCTKDDIPGYCKSVLDDLKLATQLPPSMYQLIKYEDLVENPMDEMENLYRFIGVNITVEMKEYVYKHFHADKSKGFFATFKTSNFDNSNIDGLSLDIKKTVEDSCKEVLKLGNYTL